MARDILSCRLSTLLTGEVVRETRDAGGICDVHASIGVLQVASYRCQRLCLLPPMRTMSTLATGFREDLLDHLTLKCERSIEDGSVLFTPSESITLPAAPSGFALQLTYAPALSKKPKSASDAKLRNPFEAPYPPGMHVADGTVDGEDFVILVRTQSRA